MKAMVMECELMEKKIISVTGKRQITIPLKFYKQINMGKEVECYLSSNAIIIKPLQQGGDSFATEILEDLVSQGYGGEDLINKFKEQQTKIRSVISSLISEADEIADGKRKSATTTDIFGEE